VTQRQKEAIWGLTMVAFVLVSGAHLLLGSHNYADVQMSINGRPLDFEVPQVLVDQFIYTLIVLFLSWLFVTRGVNALANTTITLIGALLLSVAVWLLYYLDAGRLMSSFIKLGLGLKVSLYWLSIILMVVVVLGSVWYTVRHRWLNSEQRGRIS